MSKVVAIREKLKKEYQASYGVNPTYLSFVARAAVETLKDYPWVNGEIRGDQIVTRSHVNLGFAVELADGKGLIVPVLKNAETLNLLGLAKGVADIARRARDKQLLPDDVQGGTFTITNPGGYGTFHGTPVISQPQAAILGTYAVVKRPWVVQDELGEDVIAIRPIMNLTPHVRPPPRRRRARRPLPARPARAARDVGRVGLLMTQATLHTNHGAIEVELYDDDAPKTVENFLEARARRVLRRRHLPPRHPGLHDPGRRSDRDRDGRPGLPVRRRAERARGRPRRARDGERGPEHERQPVLHRHHRGCSLAERQAHGLRPRHRRHGRRRRDLARSSATRATSRARTS